LQRGLEKKSLRSAAKIRHRRYWIPACAGMTIRKNRRTDELAQHPDIVVHHMKKAAPQQERGLFFKR